MGPIELHYSRPRLWMMALAGLALAGFSLWIALDPALVSGEGDRLAHRAARALGPHVVRWFTIVMCLLVAAALLMSLRLLGQDCLAARADARQLRLRGLFGTSTHAWNEVDELSLRRIGTSGGAHKLIMARPQEGRARGIMVSLLREGAAGAEIWLRKAEKLRAARGEAPGRARP